MSDYIPSYTKSCCKDCLNLGTVNCFANGWNNEGKPVNNNGELYKCQNHKIYIGKTEYDNYCAEEYENDTNWKDLLTTEVSKCNCSKCKCEEKKIDKVDLINKIILAINNVVDYNIDHFQQSDTMLLVESLVREINRAVNKTIENEIIDEDENEVL